MLHAFLKDAKSETIVENEVAEIQKAIDNKIIELVGVTKEFDEAIEAYNNRDRRFDAISKSK